MTRPKKTWYAASVIMYFRLKGGRQRSFPVWENVFLVAARTPDEARRRAEELGRAEAEAEGMTWKGKPVEMVFGGVRKVVSCAPDPARPGGADVTKLHDGVEATYSAFLVKGRAELEALLAGKPAAVVYEE